MLVSVRDGALKVLYYYGREPLDAVRALQSTIAGSRKIHSLLVAHPDLMKHSRQLRSRSIRTLFRIRRVGVSRKILEHFPDDMVIQLGDGDSAFT